MEKYKFLIIFILIFFYSLITSNVINDKCINYHKSLFIISNILLMFKILENETSNNNLKYISGYILMILFIIYDVKNKNTIDFIDFINLIFTLNNLINICK